MTQNREAVPQPDNVLGLRGIEFIEYVTTKPQALGQLLEKMGFQPVARHSAALANFTLRLHGLGYRGDYSFEVFNDDYQQIPLPVVAERGRKSATWLVDDVLRLAAPIPIQMTNKVLQRKPMTLNTSAPPDKLIAKAY
jgi:hypothetical protein